MSNKTIDALAWRAAVKVYDSTKKISTEELEAILEAGRLAPSWYGLQPWKFVVVEASDIREKLSGAAWQQPQITTASHLIILARRLDVDERMVDQLVQATATATNTPIDQLSGFRDTLIAFVSGMDDVARAAWATSQVYIPLGTMVAAASTMGIDNSPMGGFDRDAFDEILGLKAQNAASVVILAVGHRSESDEYSKKPKVRFATEEVVIKA